MNLVDVTTLTLPISSSHTHVQKDWKVEMISLHTKHWEHIRTSSQPNTMISRVQFTTVLKLILASEVGYQASLVCVTSDRDGQMSVFNTSSFFYLVKLKWVMFAVQEFNMCMCTSVVSHHSSKLYDSSQSATIVHRGLLDSIVRLLL